MSGEVFTVLATILFKVDRSAETRMKCLLMTEPYLEITASILV